MRICLITFIVLFFSAAKNLSRAVKHQALQEAFVEISEHLAKSGLLTVISYGDPKPRTVDSVFCIKTEGMVRYVLSISENTNAFFRVDKNTIIIFNSMSGLDFFNMRLIHRTTRQLFIFCANTSFEDLATLHYERYQENII